MRKFGLLMFVAALAGCGTANQKALVEKYQEVTPSRFEGSVAVVLENKATSKVDDKGEGLVLEGFKRVKILDRKASDCGEESTTCRMVEPVFYNSTWDTVELLEARTITPSGEVIPVTEKDIRDMTFTSWAFPEQDSRAKVFNYKGVVPGAILELHYRVRTKELLGAGGFRFQERDPVLEASFTLDAPADFDYKWKTFNIDIKPTEVEKGNRIVRTWTAKQVAPFFYEEDMVAPDDVLAQLKIANSKIAAFKEYKSCLEIDSWEDMGTCWSNMLVTKQEVTPAIKDVVAKIAAENKTETDKVKAVWKYMNDNVRYVGLEKGLAGFIPLSAGVVCSKKYGDCKAVAGLISVLCRELGLKADPILIGTRPALGQVPLDLPGPFHFNHSIARVEADGKVLWLDATVRDVAFDVTPYADQGVDVIVARPGAPFMDRIPVQAPDKSRADGTVVFEPGQDNAVSMEYTGTVSGNFAMMMRGATQEYTEEQFKKRLIENSLSVEYPQANLASLDVTGKDDNNAPIGLTMKAEIPKALQPVGKGVSFEVKAPIRLSVFERFTLPKRRYAVDLGWLGSAKLRYEVKIPEGMEPSGMPRNVMFEDDYVKVERLAQIENDKVVAMYDFAYKQLIIPADKYPEARKSFQKAMDASKFVVIFEPPKKKST